MKDLAVIIPTYCRISKLTRLLNSIARSDTPDVQIYVYADNNDTSTVTFLNGWNKIMLMNLKVFVNEKRLFAPGSWNRFYRENISKDWKYSFWLVDDAEVYPDTFRKAVECMCFNYPDTDGVIGIGQECPNNTTYTFKQFGQMLIGRKFVERYAEMDYQTCCPYLEFLFQDEELYLHAKALGKFVFSKEAVIKHFHPAYILSEYDSTHDLSRKNANKDRQLFSDRQKRGKIWGLNWEK